MKKVLSVLLAAAMVMGMSVSAAALTFESATTVVNTSDANKFVSYGAPSNEFCFHETTTTDDDFPVENVRFDTGFYINGKYFTNADLENAVLNPGDVLTFVPYYTTANYNDVIRWGKGIVDKHWSINVLSSEFVKSAAFGWMDDVLVVNVTVADSLDDLDEQEVEVKLYIADNYSKVTNKQSKGVKLVMPFDNYKEEYVSFDYVNDVDYMAKWIVAKNTKGTAVFDISDSAYIKVKMIPEEEVIFNFSQAYDKAIDKKYNDYDADLTFYNFKGTQDVFTKTATLLIPADEDSYIYEIVDGELVAVEAEWVDDYKMDGLNKKDGWVIETKELGYYVVADDELVVAEEEVETEVEADKANPETGAADFVGAAVAMAVVSVAAAGALALKK